jgi:hypothetical protein
VAPLVVRATSLATGCENAHPEWAEWTDDAPPEALEQTKYVFDHLEHPKKAMRILAADEGAEAHTHVNNFPRLHQVVFDWLDEALTPTGVVRGAGQARGA